MTAAIQDSYEFNIHGEKVVSNLPIINWSGVVGGSLLSLKLWINELGIQHAEVINEKVKDIVLPNHKFRLKKELPINQLGKIAENNKRLRLYVNKGINCVKCGIECNRLILAKGSGESLHWDLYDEDLTVMLTNGHIIPKSKGGGSRIENLRPLCHLCNDSEGNRLNHLLNEENFHYLKNKKVARQSGNAFQDGSYRATIKGYFFSDKSKDYYLTFNEGDFTYPANKVKFINVNT